jgi:N-methylhydantoinase A
VFSAFGMLFSDLRYDFVRTALMRLDEAPFDRIEAIYRDLEAQGRAAIANTSVAPQKVVVKRAADMRYQGQEHAVTVDLPDSVFRRRDRNAIKRLFDAMHDLRYGTSAPQENAEIVSLRATVTGAMQKPKPAKIGRGTAAPPKVAFTGNCSMYVGQAFRPAPTWRRADLLAGNVINGPARIEEHASTTVLMPGDRCTVDAYGNLVIAVGRAR